MRIVAGMWRGRKLVAPKDAPTRPTSDRVREALFSMLTSRLGSFEDLRVADLYAGSGALGLEALSRGAGCATFVENDPRAIDAIRANIDSLGAGEQARLICRSAESLPSERPFDVIFADPPYAPGSGTEVVRTLQASGWADLGTWIAIETESGDLVEAGGWSVESERTIGRARLTLIRA